jgi:N-acetyl sugar amidotransferase
VSLSSRQKFGDERVVDIIRAPGTLDLTQYAPDSLDPQTFYGLPQKIEFCAKCCYSNQKPNSEKEYKHTIDTKKPTVSFDEEGVCAACRTAERKTEVDWEERRRKLVELCDKYRSRTGHYDCLVPGSGGKDSFYASYQLKYEFGMNPLTVTWAPHMYTDWGWKNFQAWIQSGFDNYLFTPNGRAHRLLTRLAVESIFHPFQPFIMGQMYFPPKMAARLGIPLVFYGENPTEYGNSAEEDKTSKKNMSYFTAPRELSEIALGGVTCQTLIDQFGLSLVDLDAYLPMQPEEAVDKQLDVQYLGYYLPWHPQECYYFAVEKGGFQAAPERTAGTYSKYSSIDDKIDDIHYYTTFVKFGIGRATYDASQEVRNGEIDRDEALALVKKYDGEYPERFEKDIFNYLSINQKEFPEAFAKFEHPGMDREYFARLTDRFRSPHIWAFEGNKWRLRKTAYDPALK